jgi:hypothetical protein
MTNEKTEREEKTIKIIISPEKIKNFFKKYWLTLVINLVVPSFMGLLAYKNAWDIALTQIAAERSTFLAVSTSLPEYPLKPNTTYWFEDIRIWNPTDKPAYIKNFYFYHFPAEGWFKEEEKRKETKPSEDREILSQKIVLPKPYLFVVQPKNLSLYLDEYHYELQTPSKEGIYHLIFCIKTIEDLEFCTPKITFDINKTAPEFVGVGIKEIK